MQCTLAAVTVFEEHWKLCCNIEYEKSMVTIDRCCLFSSGLLCTLPRSCAASTHNLNKSDVTPSKEILLYFKVLPINTLCFCFEEFKRIALFTALSLQLQHSAASLRRKISLVSGFIWGNSPNVPFHFPLATESLIKFGMSSPMKCTIFLADSARWSVVLALMTCWVVF